MFKKIMTMILASFLLVSMVGCNKEAQQGNIQPKESVSVKESDMYKDFHLNESKVSDVMDFDKDGIKVSLTGITYEDVVTKVNFHIKNDTDKNVNIVTTDVSINGLMCTDAMMIKVDAKSEKDGHIEISNEWFSELNIDTIKDMEYVIRVLDEKSDEIVKSDIMKMKTDAPADYKQSYDKEGFVIYNKDGIVFTARELKKSKLSNDMELSFYVENNTDRSFSIMAKDVFLNSRPIEPTFVITVGAHKKAIDSMLFMDADLKGSGITEITSVKSSFRAINNDLETVFETKTVEIPVK